MTTPEMVDEIAVRMELVNACALAGGRDKFAAQHGISEQHLENMIRGNCFLPEDIFFDVLGYRKVTRYVKRAPKASSVSSPGVSLPGVGNSPASVGAFSSS